MLPALHIGHVAFILTLQLLGMRLVFRIPSGNAPSRTFRCVRGMAQGGMQVQVYVKHLHHEVAIGVMLVSQVVPGKKGVRHLPEVD